MKFIDPFSETELSSLNINCINQDLWIATIDGGINKLNLTNNVFQYYHKDSQYEKHTKSIYIDKDNRLWVIDFTGLRLYDDSLDIFHGYYHNPENPFTMNYPGAEPRGSSFCKEFANLNNGKLTDMAQLGKGSTFCLSLPSPLSD